MPIRAKYTHTNIVAKDWRRLAKFYEEVFGCTPIPPERDYRGPWINDVTALLGEISLAGMHLRLPGHGSQGPTLEIFEYNQQAERPSTAANMPGFAHIAFHVDDVSAASSAVLAAGGHELGKLHSMHVPGAGMITLIYLTDPEGNIIELQNWS
ncbi:MAG: VOC family protein [Pirellulales bacterium]|nr:VOC family protein [Pirellulales bacterium]